MSGDFSDSDPDFWDQGEKQGATKGRRRRMGRNTTFPNFTIESNTNEDDLILSKDNSRKRETKEESERNGEKRDNNKQVEGNVESSEEDENKNHKYDRQEDNSESKDNSESEESEASNSESEKSDDEESIDEDDDESDNDNNDNDDNNRHTNDNQEINEQTPAQTRSDDTSNRTSLLSGSDLPSDSPPQPTTESTNTDQPKGPPPAADTLIAGYLVPPQQRLKHAIYRGRKLLAAHEGDDAIDQFARAFALSRIVHGDHHWRTCRCRVFLAQTYLYLKGYAVQAESQAKEAIDTITINLSTHQAPPRKPQVHHTLMWGQLILGEAKTSLNQLSTAKAPLCRALYHCRVFKRMISKRKKLTASLSMDKPIDMQLKILCAQANLYKNIRYFKKARDKLELGISIVEKDFGNNEDSRLIGPLQQLGELLLHHPGKSRFVEDEDIIYFDQDVDDGIQCLERALNITLVNNRPGSLTESEARVSLVQHRLRLRRIDPQQALRELHNLTMVYSRLYGDHSPKTIALHNTTIQVLVQEEEYPRALEELTAALKTARAAFGDYSTQVCGVLRQLSRVHLLSKDMKGAVQVLDQCLTAELLLHGASSRRAQATSMRLREVIQKVPLALRMKMWRRHPELQIKPRFRTV